MSRVLQGVINMRFIRAGIIIHLFFTFFIFGCSVQESAEPEPVQEPQEEKVVIEAEPEPEPVRTVPLEAVKEYARIHQISDLDEAEHRIIDPEYARENPYTPTEEDIVLYERGFLERMYPGFKKMAEKEGFMRARSIYMRNPPAGPGSRHIGSTRYGVVMTQIYDRGGMGASTGISDALFETDPATVHHKEAMRLHRLGQLDEAIVEMEKAVQAKPDSPSMLYGLGVMYMEKQDYPKAVQFMQRSVEHIKSTGYTKVNLALYPDVYMSALTNLGLIYTRIGSHEKAAESLKEAIQFRPGDLDANYNLVNAYYVMGDMEKTAEQLKKFINLDPKNAEAHNIAGLIYYRRQLYNAALDEFQTAESLDPDEKQYNHNLGTVLAELGRTEEAREAFEKAEGLEEGADMRREFMEKTAANKVSELYNDGYDAMERQYWKLAIERFKAVLELKPDMAEAHMNLGFSYRMRGDVENQTHHFEEAARLEPDMPDVHHNLGLAYSDARMYSQAADEFRKAIEIKPSKDSYFSLGMALLRANNYADAAVQFEKSLELSPNWFEAHTNLGTCYMKLDRPDDALKQFEKALQLRGSAEAQYNLGAVYVNMGKYDEAIKLFQKTLEIYPGHKQARALLKELENYQSGQ